MLTHTSQVVNGQLVHTMPVEAYLPVNYAPVAPSSMWANAGPATIPPYAQPRMLAAPATTASISGLPPSWTDPPDSAAGWLHPTKYPVMAAVLFLVLGIIVLRYVHWRAD